MFCMSPHKSISMYGERITVCDYFLFLCLVKSLKFLGNSNLVFLVHEPEKDNLRAFYNMSKVTDRK